jgi:hypothetical protein
MQSAAAAAIAIATSTTVCCCKYPLYDMMSCTIVTLSSPVWSQNAHITCEIESALLFSLATATVLATLLLVQCK